MFRACLVCLLSAFLVAGCAGLAFDSNGGGVEEGAGGGGAGGGGGGGGGGGDPKCWSSPASKLFGNALCLCEGLDDVGAITVQAGPGESGASFGANGLVRFINHTHVDGTLAAHGGIQAVGNVEARDHVRTAADLGVTGRLDVGQDLSVGGNLSGLGWVEVGGTLRVAGAANVLGHKGSKSVGPYAPAAPPCACEPGKMFDVAAAVANARKASDNGLKGLPTSLADIGHTDLTLTSGKYFFDHVAQLGYLKITIQGTVALYLDGNLDTVGAERIALTPGSTLDLYVSGAVRNVGNLSLGDENQPSSFRLYVGGSEPVMVGVGNAEFHGAVYAPTAAITYVGRTLVRGGLFGKTLRSAGTLELTYSHPQATPPAQQLCPPKSPPPPPPGSNPNPAPLPDPDAIYRDKP